MITKIETQYITLVDEHDVRGIVLVETLKREHGHHAAYALTPWLGEGDFTHHSLFSAFRLTTLIRAAYSAKTELFAVEDDYLRILGDRAFWELTKSQQLRLKEQLLFLWPEKFQHLERW